MAITKRKAKKKAKKTVKKMIVQKPGRACTERDLKLMELRIYRHTLACVNSVKTFIRQELYDQLRAKK